MSAERVLSQIHGATIVSTDIENDDGLHIALQDGRILVIVGSFVVSLLRIDDRKLH